MDPSDLRKFKENIELLNIIKGQYNKEPMECEKSARKQARRSIVLKKDIKIGDEITEDIITFKRPGTGISPKEIYKVLGKKAKIDLKEDTILQWEMIK